MVAEGDSGCDSLRNRRCDGQAAIVAPNTMPSAPKSLFESGSAFDISVSVGQEYERHVLGSKFALYGPDDESCEACLSLLQRSAELDVNTASL